MKYVKNCIEKAIETLEQIPDDQGIARAIDILNEGLSQCKIFEEQVQGTGRDVLRAILRMRGLLADDSLYNGIESTLQQLAKGNPGLHDDIEGIAAIYKRANDTVGDYLDEIGETDPKVTEIMSPLAELENIIKTFKAKYA